MTRYVFIILFFITLFSCNKKRISNYNIDTTIDYPVFHDSILNDTNFGIESGLSEIVVKEYSIETIYSIDTCKTFCFNAYANKDTTVILFDWLNCYMKILLYDGEYEIVTKYSTDIIETYPDGEHKGTCLIADLEHQKLVFKSKSFKAGDIIYGGSL